MSFNSYIDFKIKETLKILQLMHAVILSVLTIIGGVIFKLVYDSGNTGSGDYFNSLVLLISLAGFFVALSVFVPNFIIKRIKKNRSSEAILKSYRGAYVVKYILLILPILGGFLGFLYYSNYGFFITSAAVAIIMILHRPHKKGVNRVIKA